MAGRMTLLEASEVLGVDLAAGKDEINSAYRKKVSQYHPDANRNKPEAERKHAEMMFKKVNQAKKIMLDPSLAADAIPEQSYQQQPQYSQTNSPSGMDSQYHAPRPREYQQQPYNANSNNRQGNRQQGRRGSSPYGESGSDRYYGNGYNSSTTFYDNVEHVPDPAENQITKMSAREYKGTFAKASDVFRVTPSLFITLCVMIIALLPSVILLSNGGSIIDTISMITSVGTLCMIGYTIIKFLYDLLVSYYAVNALKKKKMSWLTLGGSELIVTCVFCFVVYYVFASGNVITSIFSIACAIIAVLLIGIDISLRNKRK